MSNCRSDQALYTNVITLNDRDSIIDFFIGVISVDGDLSENEEYFKVSDKLDENGDPQPLCYQLGYANDSHMIVVEATKDKKFNTVKLFEEAFIEIFAALSDQEYFGDCDHEVIDLGDGRVVISYVYGGYNKW